MKTSNSYWIKYEPLLYWLITTIHVVPLLVSKWFVTLDGPSHLYSGRIVKELLSGNEFFGRFFHLNASPDPYWSGHIISAVLLLVFPAWIVEKLVWGVAILGLAWSFRYLIRILAPERSWASLIVMPFLLNYALWMGFLNFCLSLPLFLIATGLIWNGVKDRTINWILLSIVLSLVYFSHMFSFLMVLITIAVVVTLKLWVVPKIDQKDAQPIVIALVKAVILPVALTVMYFITRQGTTSVRTRIDRSQLLEWLGIGRAWNGFGVPGEGLACTLLAFVLLCGLLIALVYRVKVKEPMRLHADDIWLTLTILTFAAYFVVPDALAGGTNASPRFLLFGMLFLCCWLVVSPLPMRALMAVVALVVGVDLYHVVIETENSYSLGHECALLVSASDALPENSVLLPLNYGSNWLHANLSNYLGVGEKQVIVLDHFTALAPFNPAQWKKEMLPYDAIGDYSVSHRPCVSLNGYRSGTMEQVNSVLTWEKAQAEVDSCLIKLDQQLSNDFNEVFGSSYKDVTLYLRK